MRPQEAQQVDVSFPRRSLIKQPHKTHEVVLRGAHQDSEQELINTVSGSSSRQRAGAHQESCGHRKLIKEAEGVLQSNTMDPLMLTAAKNKQTNLLLRVRSKVPTLKVTCNDPERQEQGRLARATASLAETWHEYNNSQQEVAAKDVVKQGSMPGLRDKGLNRSSCNCE